MCLCVFVNSHDDIPENLSGLFSAIRDKNYPLIYEELDRCADPFSAKDSFGLLNAALEKHLGLRVFEAILERSPPAPDVISANP